MPLSARAGDSGHFDPSEKHVRLLKNYFRVSNLSVVNEESRAWTCASAKTRHFAEFFNSLM
jgi:hypothetical protein